MAWADKFRIEYSDNTSETINLRDHYEKEYLPIRLEDEDCLLIGNSYNDGTGGISGQGWGYYFQQNTGCDGVIIAQNGGDFAAVGNSNADYPGETYAGALTLKAASMTQAEKDRIQFIIVCGGYNDGSTGRNPGGYPDTLAGINDFCAVAKNNFVNARIFIIPVTANAGLTSDMRNACATAWNVGAIRNGCATCAYSIAWFYGDTALTAGDNIHLNDDGYKRLAHYVEAVIYGWDGVIYFAATALTAGADTTLLDIRSSIDGNQLVNLHGKVRGVYDSFNDVLFTLPQEFRPPYTLYTNCWYFGTSPNRAIIPLEISAGGDVRMRVDSSITLEAGEVTIYIDATYPRNW